MLQANYKILLNSISFNLTVVMLKYLPVATAKELSLSTFEVFTLPLKTFSFIVDENCSLIILFIWDKSLFLL